MMPPEAGIGELLRRRKWTLGTVESATGGLIANLITNIPGSSRYFQGAVVAYDNRIKIELVGVRPESIASYGAVSPQVAEEMAAGGRRVLGVDICLADTGMAGPGGATPEKPVGLFYIGLAGQAGVFSRRHLFSADRRENKLLAAHAALAWLKDYLEDRTH